MPYNKNLFDDLTILLVWNKGSIIPGKNPNIYRKDACGAVIEFSKHGDTKENGCGWEIDHIYPKSLGGTEYISNLQPLQWQNNRGKGDGFALVTVVTAKPNW